MNHLFSIRAAAASLLVETVLALTVSYTAEPGWPTPEEMAKSYEQSCVADLRAINVAQGTYWGGDLAKGFARTLKELGPAGVGFLDGAITSGKRDDYDFKLVPERTQKNHPIRHYIISARPLKRLTKDQRGFFTDETGVIRFTNENRRATRADPPIDPNTTVLQNVIDSFHERQLCGARRTTETPCGLSRRPGASRRAC